MVFRPKNRVEPFQENLAPKDRQYIIMLLELYRDNMLENEDLKDLIRRYMNRELTCRELVAQARPMWPKKAWC